MWYRLDIEGGCYMIFSNIILDENEKENGKWTVLDYEWVWDFAIPVQFVIYRALYYHFRNRTDGGFAMYLSRKGMDDTAFAV